MGNYLQRQERAMTIMQQISLKIRSLSYGHTIWLYSAKEPSYEIHLVHQCKKCRRRLRLYMRSDVSDEAVSAALHDL